jgi:hypothetical protein
LGKFVPKFEPETEVSVDSLSTDFDVYVSDKSVSERVSPGNDISGSPKRVYRVDRKGGELNLKVDVINQVTITRDDGGNFLPEGRVSVEDLFDRFDRKVGMSSVNHFEKSDLGVTSQVNVLGPVGSVRLDYLNLNYSPK